MSEGKQWNHSYPQHMRRAKKKKTAKERNLKNKQQDLDSNLEKLENRIYNQQRIDRMRAARAAARGDMEEGGFADVKENFSKKKRRAADLGFFSTELADSDEDYYIGSSSDDSSDVSVGELKRRYKAQAQAEKEERKTKRLEKMIKPIIGHVSSDSDDENLRETRSTAKHERQRRQAEKWEAKKKARAEEAERKKAEAKANGNADGEEASAASKKRKVEEKVEKVEEEAPLSAKEIKKQKLQQMAKEREKKIKAKESADEPIEEGGPDFIPSLKYDDSQVGYEFKLGSKGLGYYKENAAVPAVETKPNLGRAKKQKVHTTVMERKMQEVRAQKEEAKRMMEDSFGYHDTIASKDSNQGKRRLSAHERKMLKKEKFVQEGKNKQGKPIQMPTKAPKKDPKAKETAKNAKKNAKKKDSKSKDNGVKKAPFAFPKSVDPRKARRMAKTQ